MICTICSMIWLAVSVFRPAQVIRLQHLKIDTGVILRHEHYRRYRTNVARAARRVTIAVGYARKSFPVYGPLYAVRLAGAVAALLSNSLCGLACAI